MLGRAAAAGGGAGAGAPQRTRKRRVQRRHWKCMQREEGGGKGEREVTNRWGIAVHREEGEGDRGREGGREGEDLSLCTLGRDEVGSTVEAEEVTWESMCISKHVKSSTCMICSQDVSAVAQKNTSEE
jgi:hypothetical protein